MINIIKALTSNEQIKSMSYIIMGKRTTICLLTLEDGFEIVGTNVSDNPTEINIDVARHSAFLDAYSKLQEIEKYKTHIGINNYNFDSFRR